MAGLNKTQVTSLAVRLQGIAAQIRREVVGTALTHEALAKRSIYDQAGYIDEIAHGLLDEMRSQREDSRTRRQQSKAEDAKWRRPDG